MRLLCDSARTHHQVKLLLYPTIIEFQLLGIETIHQVIAINAIIDGIVTRDRVFGVLIFLGHTIATRKRKYHL